MTDLEKPQGGGRCDDTLTGALALALLLILSCPAARAQQCPTYFPGSQVGTVAHGSLDEISGIAASRENPGVLWVHNDSGDSARVFAMNAGGDHLGIYNLGGASAVDYEDIAIGPGPLAGTDYLYVADTGNNALNRSTVTVYRVPEPAAAADQSPVTVDLAGVDALPMTFPGATYDCETLLVDPNSGDLYLVSRDRGGVSGDVSFVFRNPAPHTPGVDVTLELVTSFAAPEEIKGGDISADGSQIVLRPARANVAVDARWWAWDGVSSLASVFSQASCPVPAAAEPQGEAIAFAPDGLSYFTVSENANQPVYQYLRATPPAAPGGLSALAQSSSEIALAWSDNSPDEDGFEVRQSLDGVNYSAIATVPADTTGLLVTGLQPGTLYHYIVRAYNVAGQADSNTASATTFAPSLPEAPSALLAFAVTSSQIDLTWEDNSGDEDGFEIHQSLDGVAFNPIGTVGPDSTSAALNALSPDTTYFYFVRAFNNVGGSDSNVASATTPPPAPVTLLSDDFESGGLEAAPWSITSPASVTSSAAATGSYGALLKKSGAITATAAIQSATSVTISYARSTSGLDASEHLFAEYSADGSAWTVLEQIGGTASWESMQFTIVPESPSLQLRFRLSGSAGNDIGRIDDVLVTGVLGVPNSPPVANADGHVFDEDSVLSVPSPGVLVNDTDEDADAVTAVLATGTSFGTLDLGDDGSFTYQPGPDFNGVDSFTYVANDGLASSAPATVTLTVNPLPDPPVASEDDYTVESGGSLAVPAPGVLGNDLDADGDPLTASLFAGVANGTLELSADGSFDYTPTPGFVGVDSFVYTAADGTGESDNATVMITVQEIVEPSAMHVGSIVVDLVSAGRGQKQGRAIVLVQDEFGNPVSGVTVSGSFTEDLNESLSAPTDANGLAELITSSSAKGGVRLSFCVDDLQFAGLSYDPAANAESCDTSY